MAKTDISIVEIFLQYMSRTKPLMLIFHLFWIFCTCIILSFSYVMAFHFTSLVHIYEEAHNIRSFNSNLKISSKVDLQINELLTKVLAETNANRAYLFRYHNGLAAVNGVPFFFQTNTHEVISPGTTRLMQFYQRVPAGLTPGMNQKLSQNECVVVNNIDKSSDMQVLYFHQARQAKAMLRCPIFMENGDLFGFVGVDWVSDQTLDKINKDKPIIIALAANLTKIFLSHKK